ncbi:MAG: hypothetical protein RRY09_04345 [Oscillospiraceae bacterium]
MDFRLIINSIAHLLTDALCAASLFGAVAATGDMGIAVALYNTLAFSTQCVAGLITDRLRRHERIAAAALAVVALGALLPLPWLARVIVISLGNSVFHVAAGTVTLKTSAGRAAPLGVFVAPGALGLALGTLYPAALTYYAILALLTCTLMPREPTAAAPKPREAVNGSVPWLAVTALLLAVAVRAIGGGAVPFPWRSGALPTLLLAIGVLVGKAAGGFLCDRIGAVKTALVSIPAAALLTAFCGQYAAPSLVGQLLLNLSMPVTLWLLYRAMPDSPGLAFGLAASALWPGALMGGLISLTGSARAICVILCFAFGLAAIVYSQHKVKEVSP